jgi:hypothetical protein
MEDDYVKRKAQQARYGAALDIIIYMGVTLFCIWILAKAVGVV